MRTRVLSITVDGVEHTRRTLNPYTHVLVAIGNRAAKESMGEQDFNRFVRSGWFERRTVLSWHKGLSNAQRGLADVLRRDPRWINFEILEVPSTEIHA